MPIFNPVKVLTSMLKLISSTYRYYLVSFLLFASCEKTMVTDPNYEKEIMNFRQSRVAFLKSEKGYINLVGLFWLREGKNSFGSGADNDMVFPEEFPENFGVAIKSGESIKFDYSQPVTHNDQEDLESLTFLLDERPNLSSWKSFQWFILESGGNYAVRLRNFENPALKKPLNLNFYPVDNEWRIMGQYEAYPETRTRAITNIRDIGYDQQAPGIITFKRNGKNYSLEPNTSGESMSVIFMDGSTGEETFSGGRFLLLDKPDNHGKIILDFNKALNFPCAFNAFTTCPVPPEKNRLPLIVSSGERPTISNMSP